MKQNMSLQAGGTVTSALAASAIVAFLSIFSFTSVPLNKNYNAEMHIEPHTLVAGIDESFSVTLYVEATVPSNVFAGILHYNPRSLYIEKIDYHTSIADLWAERPWYSNGDGTLTFAGGTTRPGGMTGMEKLLTVHFISRTAGQHTLTLSDTRILLHDGMGSDAALRPSIDTIVSVEDIVNQGDLTVNDTPKSSHIQVLSDSKTVDLNGDGKLNLADISIFMGDLTLGNTRSDFDENGSVNMLDLSILLNAM